MNIGNKCKIKDISKCLVDEFKAQQITKEDLLNLSGNLSTIELNDNSIIYKISDLDINGKILKDLGYKGKEIGEKLNFLLDEVIKNHLLNKKDILINLLKL